MKKVHILPPEIISKIAAGEVIERPASVIKELMENSLDAETSSIELHLKNAGKSLIHIKDSGTGIDADDIEKVFLRHSTSKISGASDLYRIKSLGFRGEALYSIAAISDIILRSKTQTADSGWQIHCRGSEKINLRPTSMTNGTEIEVKELFFNTPARKKFLKSDTTEFKQIINVFLPYAILYPKIRFLLTHNGKTIIDLAEEKDHLDRVSAALNLDKNFLLQEKRKFPEKDIEIRLILGDINIQRGNKDLQYLFINNRPVENRNLSYHLNQVYRLIMPEEVKPFFAVYITLPPEDLDVNVHPTKREVKIKDEYNLVSILRYFTEQTLMTQGKAKQVNPNNEPIFKIETSEFPSRTKNKQDYKSDTKPRYNNRQPYFATFKDNLIKDTPAHLHLYPRQDPVLFQDEKISDNITDTLITKLNSADYIGVFRKKYLLFETKDSMLIIDQHAAHERVNFEKLQKQLESGKIEVQNLLTPILIKLNFGELTAWEEVKPHLEKLGFSTTAWDNDTIALHSHPQLINNPETAARNILSGEDAAKCDIATLARRACRQSIMVGDRIKKEQALYLRDELIKCKTPFNCPHGRPTVVEIQDSFLNKQFLR